MLKGVIICYQNNVNKEIILFKVLHFTEILKNLLTIKN